MASALSSNLATKPLGLITPQDVAGMDSIKELKLSRDGSRVVYTAGPAYKSGDNKTSAIWVADTSTENSARPLTSGEHCDYSPVFSPSSSTEVYFLSDRDEAGGSGHLYRLSIGGSVIDVEKGVLSVVQLGDRQGVGSFAISPDGHFLAFILETKVLKKGEKETIKIWREDKFYNTLRLVDLRDSSKSSRELVSENAHVVSFTWSPDSAFIAYRLLSHADLEARVGLLPETEKIISIASHETRDAFQYARPPRSDTVWREQGDFVFLQKRQPLELASVDTLWSWAPSHEKLSETEAEYLAYGDTNDLSRITDLQRKSQYVVEVAENLITKLDIWEKDNKYGFTVFQTEDHFAIHDWDMILTENGKYIFVAIKSSAVSGELSNIWSGATEYGQKGILSKKLSSHNPWFESKLVPNAKPFYWKGTDGLQLEGVISYPKDVELKKLPTIIVAHGGPASRDTLGLELAFSRWRPFLASYGYLVFSPNYRGGLGRGDSFAMAANGVGSIEWLDIEAMIEEGIAQGIVDPERIGIGSYSQGGFLAAFGVTRPNNNFKVAVIGAGVTDWGMLAATSDIPDLEANLGGGAPWRAGEPVYLKGSPIKDVKNVTAPVLLVHGKDDARVPVTQAISFVRGLEREAKLEVPPKLVIYPREDHGFEERGNCEDILTRVLEHVQKYLKV